MKVRSLATGTTGDLVRASAKVTWEDCDRPERVIYFDTHERFRDHLSPNPNAFLLATVMFALRHGEKRVSVEGTLCPRLRNGVITALQQLKHWHGEPYHRIPAIEATEGFAPPRPIPDRRTASFMSGGVDALALVRRNRLDFPLEHPASIRDCFFLYGFDLGCHETLEKNEQSFETARASLAELADRTHLTLIPVYTNTLHLDDDDNLAFYAVFGALLAATAHVFARRVSRSLIASSDDVRSGLSPMGSHPLLDPSYSSADLTIAHEGTWMSRLDKVRLIADWDDGLRHLRTCFDYFRSADRLNCGRCEKCLRTMTELLVCGKLEDCAAYPFDDLTPEILKTLRASASRRPPAGRKAALDHSMRCLSVANVKAWRELLEPLVVIGRRDLAAVIRHKVARFERYRTRLEGRDWYGKIERFDRAYLGGSVRRAVRYVRRDR